MFLEILIANRASLPRILKSMYSVLHKNAIEPCKDPIRALTFYKIPV